MCSQTEVWNYWSALKYLFKVGGYVTKDVYPNGETLSLLPTFVLMNRLSLVIM